MEKIQQSVLQRLEANALLNEVIVVGSDCDVGVEEYLKAKAQAIRKVRNIYSPIEENLLMLEYPSPKCKTVKVFERFFESVAITAKNSLFEGCFAIDITEYADCLDDPRLEELMAYVKLNSQAVYCFVVYTKNAQVAERVYNFIAQSGIFIMHNFELPSPQRLADYTASLIREFVQHIETETSETLVEIYKKNEYGYDFAEYLAKTLASRGYEGGKEELLKGIEQVKKINLFEPGDVSYGY